MARVKFSFSDAIRCLQETEHGKEATMYGHLRDVFIQVLGYPASDVDIDTTGEDGRPDVTLRAPSGLIDKMGRPKKIPWIVVEAKDERAVFSDPDKREDIFAEKAKYIGTNTGWFVMVDPTTFVARRVGGRDGWIDISVDLANIRDEIHFLELFSALKCDIAGVSDQLGRFRQGDEGMIAVEKLTRPDPLRESKAAVARHKVTKKRFFSNLREATQHLQDACSRALEVIMPKVIEAKALYDDFQEKYGHGYQISFDTQTLILRGSPEGIEEAKQHEKDVLALKKKFAKEPYIARLAIEGIPAFQDRTGADPIKLIDLFTLESANLILARILLLRFFEDHGFFGKRKYVCNGGVEAFQKMREYFEASYTHLLERAYKQASRLYSAAFDETEMDWVFGTDDPELSGAIEWTLFQFARYDFQTVKGDILTGIYDRFMDRAKRKELGEFYTPPSIARYILKRVGIRRGDRIFDPACGSGTFLIEAYRELVGHDVERGIAEYSDVAYTLDHLCGNDLNTFSSLLSQIQLLWQILGFKTDIEAHGFPDLPVTSRVNSLVPTNLLGTVDRFIELDTKDYAAVVGNPPYVRRERSAQDLDRTSARWYEQGQGGHSGISSKLNAYALFIYRALNSWCREGIPGVEAPGKLGFIIPTSLFDANENSELRSLFKVGGRWTILEILDLEIIYRQIFDADVLPVIIICENRSAKEDDKVSIRIANKECVKPGEDGGLAEFNFDSLPVESVPYGDIFTSDGRILTRPTEARLKVIRKLWANPTLISAAKRFWVRKVGARIVEWADRLPTSPEIWEEQTMIRGGIAFRGNKPNEIHGNGLDIYKGENVISAELQGDPVMTNCDMNKVDDSSLWKYIDILPQKAVAVAQVAHCVNAVVFNPRNAAFTNTATIFVPGDAQSVVPFDLLFLSNIYIYFYCIAARMGVLRLCRSHIYPTNLAVLPWNDNLIQIASLIEERREPLVTACRKASDADKALTAAIESLRLKTLKFRMQDDQSTRVAFGDNFLATGYEAEIVSPMVEQRADGMWRVQVSDDIFDWVDLTHETLAKGVLEAIQCQSGASISRSGILNLPIPVGPDEYEAWNGILAHVTPDLLLLARNNEIQNLDRIIAPALGLNEGDLESIWKDCAEDPFMKRIKPRYPGTVTRKLGFRSKLGSGDRYK